MQFECRIIVPKLPGRRFVHRLDDHECVLEIRAQNGKLRQRQVRLTEAREMAGSVAIRCYLVGSPKSEVDTYWVPNIVAIYSPNGSRFETLPYLKTIFGLVIE